MILRCDGRNTEDDFNTIRFYLNNRNNFFVGYQFIIEWVNKEGVVSPYSCHRPPAADKMLVVLMKRHFPSDDSFFRSKIQSDQIIITIRAGEVRSLSGAISKMYKLLKSTTSGFKIKYIRECSVIKKQSL